MIWRALFILIIFLLPQDSLASQKKMVAWVPPNIRPYYEEMQKQIIAVYPEYDVLMKSFNYGFKPSDGFHGEYQGSFGKYGVPTITIDTRKSYWTQAFLQMKNYFYEFREADFIYYYSSILALTMVHEIGHHIQAQKDFELDSDILRAPKPDDTACTYLFYRELGAQIAGLEFSYKLRDQYTANKNTAGLHGLTMALNTKFDGYYQDYWKARDTNDRALLNKVADRYRDIQEEGYRKIKDNEGYSKCKDFKRVTLPAHLKANALAPVAFLAQEID